MDFLTHVVATTSPKKRKAIDCLEEVDPSVSSPVKLARTAEIAAVKTNTHHEDFVVLDFVEFPTVEVRLQVLC